MTTALYIALAILIVALALMGWAIFNPKWQGADAYEAYNYFVPGACLLVLAVLWVLGAWVMRAAGWL